VCQEGGARLCTAEELQNDEARGAGCNYDGALVWLMSPAPAALPSLTTPTVGGQAFPRPSPPADACAHLRPHPHAFQEALLGARE
jgi:hypothetical protein